jgi:ArsR family transcriptional regulator, virulence genes transcriptional regulator
MNVKDLTSRSEEVVHVLKAMSNTHRLLILCELYNGERSVSALEAVVPLSQSALSQHLAKLRDYGVVTTRREAQSIYYSLTDPRVASLIGSLHELFCEPAKSRKKRSKE